MSLCLVFLFFVTFKIFNKWCKMFLSHSIPCNGEMNLEVPMRWKLTLHTLRLKTRRDNYVVHEICCYESENCMNTKFVALQT